MYVRQILSQKGHDVVSVRPEADLLTAARFLKSMGVGALVVSADGRGVDGLLSERDVVVAFAEHPELFAYRRVSEVMRRDVYIASPDTPVETVMAEMTRRRQRQAPVVEAGTAIGVVSVGDILHHRLAEATLETRVLRDVAIARS